MRRADLRTIREQLENVHITLVSVEARLRASSPVTLRELQTARTTLREQITRLPDAEVNRHRLYPVPAPPALEEVTH